MWLLTLRDLQYRRVRVLVVVALASVVMALLFLMTGLVNQFNHEPFDATRAVGAEHWVLAEGTSGPFTSAGTLPSTLVGDLGGDAHGVVVARGTIAEVGADEESCGSGRRRRRAGEPAARRWPPAPSSRAGRWADRTRSSSTSPPASTSATSCSSVRSASRSSG